jgi:acid stress chaperone HdeB
VRWRMRDKPFCAISAQICRSVRSRINELGKSMKVNTLLLASAALWLQAAPAKAVVLDLSTMSCKQFIESGPDEIKMVLTWMDGWYKGDQDEAIIDTDVFVANAKKFGIYCASHPTVSIVTAAEKVLGE